MRADDIELWTASDGVRCFMREGQPGWTLILARAHHILKTDTFPDAHFAIAAADQWQQQYQERRDSPSADDDA